MADPNEPLTERELQIVQLLATGAANKDIAAQLFLSPNTVKVHLRNIFTKLQVQTRTEATMIAVRNGWVQVQQPATSSPPEQTQTETETEAISDKTVAVAPNPQLLPPLSLRRRAGLVIALVLAILFSGVSLRVRPSDANGNATDIENETQGSVATSPLQAQSSRWVSRASVKSPRARSMAAVHNGMVYLVGGEVGANKQILADVLVYEPLKDQWRDLNAPKPTPVLNTSGVVIANHLYFPGGLAAGNVQTDRFERLDLTDNTWSALPRLPRPSSGHAVAAHNQQVFIFGGRNSGQTTNESHVFDLALQRWVAIPKMPTARENAAAAVLNGRIFVVGGFDGRRELNVCEYYEPISQTWHTCKPMTTGRSSFGLVAVGNYLYAVGGGTTNFIGWNEKLDPNTNIWTTFETPHAGDWRQVAVAALPTAFFVVGGKTKNVPLSDNYVYEVLTNRTFLPAFNANGK